MPLFKISHNALKYEIADLEADGYTITAITPVSQPGGTVYVVATPPPSRRWRRRRPAGHLETRATA